MVWQRIRIALFVCTVLAVSASTAFAQEEGGKDKDKDKKEPEVLKTPPVEQPHPGGIIGGGGGGCGAPCGTRTIYVTECVPETYTARRIVYRSECRTENYTAYRCETVPEVRERTVCVTRRVPVVRTECRRVCVTVPVCEERTVMKQTWTYQNVTTMQCRTVDRGHWECREVFCARKAMHNWFNGLGRGHGHRGGDDCCNPCPQECQAPPTRTVKVWVPCRVTEQVPVTCCKKVSVCTPCTVRVTVNRTEWREQQVQVCTYQCVTENRVERYTVCTTRQVPYQACRTVRVCVPCEETYTACRMVSRTVARQVADTSCCSSPCNPCCESGGRGHGLFNRGGHGGGGWFNRGGHGGGHGGGYATSGGCCN
jgi:hypothetical protein